MMYREPDKYDCVKVPEKELNERTKNLLIFLGISTATYFAFSKNFSVDKTQKIDSEESIAKITTFIVIITIVTLGLCML